MDVLKRAYVAFLLLVVAIVTGAGACGFDPQVKDGAFACGADRSCPNGFVCAADNRCYRPGNGPLAVTPDGGVVTPDGGSPFVPSKLQADPVTLAEGTAGTTDFVFTIRLDPPSPREVKVDYATVEGTAKSGDDFASASGSLIFPPGATSQTVNIKVIGDRFEEPDESFMLRLTNLANAEMLAGVSPDIAATIKNDDGPGLVIDDLALVEGDVDTTATLTVSLSGTFTTEVKVNFETVAGTALAGLDFLETSGVVTFAVGEKTKQVLVPIKGDLAHEKEESFTVKLSAPVGTTILDDGATVRVTDNDPIPSISVADTSLAEGDAGPANMTFVLSLSAASSEEIKVNFTTGGGTAVSSDYASTSGTVTFPPGTTTQNVIVAISGDLTDEVDETFVVTLATPVNATVGKATATGTILDDDAPPILTVRDVALAEGNGGTTTFSFPFTLATASAKTVSITWATTNGTATAPSDFTAVNATVLTFLPGETSKTVDVVVAADAIAEPTEAFTLTLTNPQNVTPPVAAPTGTIINDDGAAATLAIADVEIDEGQIGTTELTFTVTCTGSLSGITVNYTTANGTATAGSDYATTSGTLGPFDCGDPTKPTIKVTIIGDNAFEPNETFSVNLSSPSTDVAITDSQGIGTIKNDDSQPEINIAPVAAAEGDVSSRSFGFDVTLTNPASTAVTVDYATSEGASNPATAGTDYVTTSGTLTFAPGETSKTINVTVNGDVVFEPDEAFRVTLSGNSANSTLGTAVGVGTITNDELQPTVGINDVTLTEGNSGSKNFTFTLTLSGPSYQTVSVNFATANGTAAAGVDYTAKSGTVSFAPGGPLTQTIDVAVAGDASFEENETFEVVLSAPVNTTITDDTGVATITNDDQARLITINDVSVAENVNGGNISFTISVSLAAPGTTSVSWTVLHLSTSNADFNTTTLSGVANINSNQTSTTLTLPITNDTLDELDEQFEIHLSNPTNNSQIGDGIGIGTITDNDPSPNLSLVGPAGSINEGDTGTVNATFNVNLSAVSGRTVTVQYATRDGTAKSSNPGKDYEAQTGTLTFLPGETQKQIFVPILGDATKESDESFFVDLSNASGATINTASDNATVNNDD